VQKLVAPERAVADLFGICVSISSSYAVVGANAEDEDSADNNYLFNAGSAYIYKTSDAGSSWSLAQKTVASSRSSSDRFGSSIDVEGEIVVVGASANTGSAYVFRTTDNGTSWSQIQKLSASDGTSGDGFSSSLDISGDSLCIGARGDDSNTGSAYVFTTSNGGANWSQSQKLVSSDRSTDDFFGGSVSISSGKIICGAIGDDHDASGGNTLGLSGSAYFFTTADVSLPVELSKFSVEQNENIIDIFWTTESEIENLGFIIEKQNGSSDWTELANFNTDLSLVGQGSTNSTTNYEYHDKFVEPGSEYSYRLIDVSYTGVKKYHYPANKNAMTLALHKDFILKHAFPNPFNPITKIQYELPENSVVSLIIYDISGRSVQTLVSRSKASGSHEVVWNGRNRDGEEVAGGMYFARLQAGESSSVVKMVYLR
jgi:hypothetical protein